MPDRQPFNWIRGQSYGPIVGETTRSTNYGPRGNALTTYDVAASPDILAQHPLGSTFTYGGNTYRVGDVSYRSEGNPNSNTLEFRDTADPGNINPADIQWNSGNSSDPGSFLRFDQNQSPSFWQGGDRAFEWDPKQGGIVGKIAAHMPGVPYYLAGQSIFDFIRGGLGKLFGGGQQPQQQAAAAPSPAQPWDPNAVPSAAAPTPFVPPPWLMPQTPEYGGQGFGNYAQAQNAFIPGLIDWNRGAANPTAGEAPGDSVMALRDRELNAQAGMLALSRMMRGGGITGPGAGADPGTMITGHLPPIRGIG